MIRNKKLHRPVRALINAVAISGGLALAAGVAPVAAQAAPSPGPGVDYSLNRPHGGGHGGGGHGGGGRGGGGHGNGGRGGNAYGGGHGFYPPPPLPHLCVPFLPCR